VRVVLDIHLEYADPRELAAAVKRALDACPDDRTPSSVSARRARGAPRTAQAHADGGASPLVERALAAGTRRTPKRARSETSSLP
jgi:hypothetical protein